MGSGLTNRGLSHVRKADAASSNKSPFPRFREFPLEEENRVLKKTYSS